MAKGAPIGVCVGRFIIEVLQNAWQDAICSRIRDLRVVYVVDMIDASAKIILRSITSIQHR